MKLPKLGRMAQAWTLRNDSECPEDASVFDILVWGLSHFRCRWSGNVEEALAKKVELGAAKHLALQGLESVDLALGLAIAPLRRDGRLDGSLIASQSRRQGADLGLSA